MKIILKFIHWLFGGRSRPGSKCPEGAASETPGKLPDQIAPQPERGAFSDDDSPPGHKIRWHL